MKICGICKLRKDFLEFNKNKSKKDGYGVWCRSCMKIYRKSHYKKNPVMVKDKVSKRRQEIRDWISNVRMKSKCSKCRRKSSGYIGLSP